MKVFAVLMIVLCLLSFAAIGYIYLNANVVVTPLGVSVAEASSDTSFFDRIRTGFLNDTFTGTVFSHDIPEEAGSFVINTYRVSIENHSFIDIDLPELTITPFPSDIAGICPAEKPGRLSPGKSTELVFQVLSGNDTGSTREISVSWYIFGIPFSVHASSGSH